MSKEVDRIHMQRLMAADELTFSYIYEQYWASLFKYVIRILPDQSDAADVIQETFITFWELREKQQHIKSIKAYLFIMARNLAFKRFRMHLRQHEFQENFIAFHSQWDQATQQSIETKDLSSLIDGEIDKLPERMREVFILSRKEHLSYQEIAEKLGISDATVKKQISNALKYLRLRIDEEYIPYLMLLILLDLCL